MSAKILPFPHTIDPTARVFEEALNWINFIESERFESLSDEELEKVYDALHHWFDKSPLHLTIFEMMCYGGSHA